jgi:hypothetical protein
MTIAPQITIYVNGQPVTFNNPSVTMLNPTPGSLQEAVQRVFNVLLVPLHSQILAWPYGLDTSWIDAPFNRRQQQAMAAAVSAIANWVPNVSVKSCKVYPDPTDADHRTYIFAVTLDFTPPNRGNQAVFGPPGGTTVTTVDMNSSGVPAVVVESLTI